MQRILISAAALAFCSTPAFAQDADEPQDHAEAEAEAGDDEIVVTGEVIEEEVERCHYVPITGTRFRERICMTVTERREQYQNTRDLVNDHRYDGAPPVETDANGFPIVPPI